jgi:hypothetical protein
MVADYFAFDCCYACGGEVVLQEGEEEVDVAELN